MYASEYSGIKRIEFHTTGFIKRFQKRERIYGEMGIRVAAKWGILRYLSSAQPGLRGLCQMFTENSYNMN